MTQRDNTPAVYLRKLFDVLDEVGVGSAGLATHQDITPADLQRENVILPLERYVAAIEYATTHYDIPELGFMVGEHTSVLEHGVFGYALLSSPDLLTSLQRYVRYQNLQGPLLSVELDITPPFATLTAVPRPGPWRLSPKAYRYMVQEWLVGWNQWCPIIGKSGAFFEHVRLGYPGFGATRFYENHLGCTVSFGNPTTTAMFPASWLRRPLRYSDDAIAALCKAQCDRLLEVVSSRPGIATDIHQMLAASPGDVPSMPQIAEQLKLGNRTLRRKLLAEATTFQDIVIEYRVAMTKLYLQETHLPTNEIAALVGYSDPANLYRVFRAHTSVTPSTWRTENKVVSN